MVFVVQHYDDVVMGAMTLKSPASRLFTQPFIRAQIKENIKAPRHWPLCGGFTGDRWISRTNGQLRGKCFHLMTSSWWCLCYNLTRNKRCKYITAILGHLIHISNMEWDDIVSGFWHQNKGCYACDRSRQKRSRMKHKFERCVKFPLRYTHNT